MFFKSSTLKKQGWQLNVRYDSKFETNIKLAKYNIMMECQLLHHIDKQITETIKELETIDTPNEDVKTYCRNIVDLLPHVDSMTEELLEKYRQLGLLFSFNIKEKPKLCSNVKIVSSLVILEAVSNILWRVDFKGISLNGGGIHNSN